MAAEISDITEGNQREILSDRDLIVEALRRLDHIGARLDALEEDWSGLLRAWSAGGLRGLRHAAGNFLTRPDPDGSRARFLADGLANLQTMGKSHDD